MALQYRKAVLDFILASLDAGFNEKINAGAPIYGVDPFTIDFTPASVNFALCNVDKPDVEICQLLQFPGGCLYTENVESFNEPRGLSFTGSVIACIDFYIRDRTGIGGFDMESPIDRIEDAVMEVMSAAVAPVNQNISVIYTRRTKCIKDRVIPLGDGVGHRVSIQMQFNVFVK